MNYEQQPGTDTWRNGEEFIRVDCYDDSKPIEYELWEGSDATGHWETLGFFKSYDSAVAAAKREAANRNHVQELSRERNLLRTFCKMLHERAR